MNELTPQTPPDLAARSARETTTVALEAQDVATHIPAEAMAEVAEDFNLLGLDRESVRTLAKLGIFVEGVGSVQLANGATYLAIDTGIALLAKIKEGASDPDRAAELADPYGKVARSLATLNNSLKTKAATSAKAAPGPNRVKTFPVDAAIQVEKAIIVTPGKST